MDAQDCRRRAIELLDACLAGGVRRESVWEWAQEIILSDEYDQLPDDLQDHVQGIWLLHDEHGSWVPLPPELRRIRDQLAMLYAAYKAGGGEEAVAP